MKKGFTLIELIVTCSIIALIALIAIPVYTKYRLRAKVATMVSAGNPAQLAVANDYFNQGYTFANTTFAAGSQPFLVPSVNYITSINVSTGWVRVIGNATYLNGNQINLAFKPTVTNNNITWTCYITPGFFSYAPTNCQNSCGGDTTCTTMLTS